MCDHETRYYDFENRNTILEGNIKQTSDYTGIAHGGKGAILCGNLLNQIKCQTVVGIKRLYIKERREEVEQALRREIAVWCNLENQNILELLGIVVLGPTPENYFPKSTVFPYYVHGDLKKYRTNNDLDHPEILKLLRDTAAGLAYIHQHKIVHGDLKDVNVVVEQPGRARVCDFGSSYALGCVNCIASPPNAFDSLITQRYLSPEIRSGGDGRTTQQSDIWALGCIFLEVLTGLPPYKSNTDHAFGWIRKQLKGEYPAERSAFASSTISADIGKIVFICWEREPSMRPQAQGVLENLERMCVEYGVEQI